MRLYFAGAARLTSFLLTLSFGAQSLASVAVCHYAFLDEHTYIAAIDLGDPIYKDNGDVYYPVLDAGVFIEADVEGSELSLERRKDREFEKEALKLSDYGAQVVFNHVPEGDDAIVGEPYKINFRYYDEPEETEDYSKECVRVEFSEWSQTYQEMGGTLSE
jgi:hypothetical protein